MQPSQTKNDASNHIVRPLGIILGASSFPKAPGLGDTDSFRFSAEAMAAYMASSSGLNIPGERVLNLFDSSLPPAEQLASVRTFLEKYVEPGEPTGPSDLVLYFVGHGTFASDQAYCLAIRTTDKNHVGPSSLRGRELAEVLQEWTALMRRHLVLDCCFAALLANQFQGAPGEILSRQVLEDYPRLGISLLCASGTATPALLSSTSRYTTFSDALLQALKMGDDSCGSRMSMQELRKFTQDILKREFPASHTRPEIHAPFQSQGDTSFFPFFPNPSFSNNHRIEPKSVTETPAILEAHAEVAAANIARAEREVMVRLVTEALTKYRRVHGLHLSPTIPASELAQALELASVPRFATVLGLGVVNIYFKLMQFGRVVDSFALFTDTGVYLHNTWNKIASTEFMTYPDLYGRTLRSTSQSYHVARVGGYTHVTLHVGSYAFQGGDFGNDDKTSMGVGDLENILSDLQAVLKSSSLVKRRRADPKE